MTNPVWAPGLPYQSVRDQLKPKLKSRFARTQMDDGSVRVRSRFTKVNRTIAHQHVFTLNQFDIFESWYEHVIDGGAAWFDMPVWHQSSYKTVTCRYADEDGYAPTLSGVAWLVNVNIEIDGYVISTVADINTRFPGAITVP